MSIISRWALGVVGPYGPRFGGESVTLILFKKRNPPAKDSSVDRRRSTARIGPLHVDHRSCSADLDGSNSLGRGLTRLGALVSSFRAEAD
jgi:hypothetical protein